MPFIPVKEFELNSTELNFEEFIQKQLLLDVQGNLKRNTKDGLCKFFLKGNCTKSIACPYPHNKTGKSIMCKHWLRGLCKKNEDCEFLHEYNLKKMPECFFYQQYRECGNGEDCIFVHVDPESKIRECDWYKRGFCRHGPDCKSRHVRRTACELYLTGFCPYGKECENGHPKNEIPIMTDIHVPFTPSHDYSQRGGNYGRNNGGNFSSARKLTDVTCFKCNNKGHYANNCPNSMKFRQQM